MYTILITKENTVVATEKDAIMEKSSLVDVLQFIVEKEYNGFDMINFTAYIYGFAPITHEIHVEQLQLVDDNYKDMYYAYQLPMQTRFTLEPGELSYTIRFLMSDIDPDTGKVVNYVRNIGTGYINIWPIDKWFAVPDPALERITQLLLANQQAISALRNVADQIQLNAPEDLLLNTDSEEIYLTNDGRRVGRGFTLSDLDNALGRVNGRNDRTINI